MYASNLTEFSNIAMDSSWSHPCVFWKPTRGERAFYRLNTARTGPTPAEFPRHASRLFRGGSVCGVEGTTTPFEEKSSSRRS